MIQIFKTGRQDMERPIQQSKALPKLLKSILITKREHYVRMNREEGYVFV